MAAADNALELKAYGEGDWRLHRWERSRIVAGVMDRHADSAQLLSQLAPHDRVIEAEQVHGSSIAVIERLRAAVPPIAGCDALLTNQPGFVLLMRSADCLPLLIAAPLRGIIGIVHAGWRGLAAGLAGKVIAALRHRYHVWPEELQIMIGPAIHACCYEVGQEFAERFGSFVRQRGGRRTCDLIAAAKEQLQRAGFPAGGIVDSGHCTSCESTRWLSVHREGGGTGRIKSFVMLRP